jgi:hypothetical protein
MKKRKGSILSVLCIPAKFCSAFSRFRRQLSCRARTESPIMWIVNFAGDSDDAAFEIDAP